MKRFQWVILIAWVAVSGSAIEPQTDAAAERSEDQHEEKTMSFWMEKKLEHSQAILRGLAMGDFEDVKYNAGRLKVLNRVEGFVRRKNPDYRSHLNTFSRVSAEIERQAERQNIEGATLAFNQLTVSCVDCHKSIRSEAAGLENEPVTDPSPVNDSR
jgi:hypothetical protein